MKATAFKLTFYLVLCFTYLLSTAKAQSLYMPAATNWVSVGDLDVAGDQLTVEALIYYTGASVNIVSKHTNPGDVNYLLRIGSFEISTTSGFAAFSGVAAAGVTLSANKMYHVAATYDGAMLKYYVNGCLTGQMPWTGNMVQSDLITAIGNQSTCQCEQFTGYIDEVRIWNVARTQAEITGNMINLPSPATQPGLLGYWKFDGNYINLQGNPVFDGTPVGAPVFQQAPLPYPVTLHESVTSSNPICSGEANGLINISAVGYYSPYEYSLDGITYTPAPSFTGLGAGTYTVYTRPQNNNSCAVSSTVTLTDPPVLSANLTTTQVSCNGGANGTAAVAPSGGDGPDYDQLWQPSLSTASSVTGLAAGNYSVEVSDTCRAAGTELVANGHFEDGNTGFTSGYACCAGGPGNYAVDADPNYYNGGHFGSGYGGGGNYMILDGSTVAGTSFWCQTIAVAPNSYYSLSAFVSSTYTAATAVVDFTINGVSVGTANAPASTFTWDPFQAVWFSGASTSATICISDLNTIPGGNDFGIDNISFKTCLSCIVNTPFTITEPTAITLSTTQTNVSCNGGANGTATVTANGGTPGYTYSWSTTPVQNTATATNLAAGSYTVTVTDLNACTANITVTITEPTPLSVAISAQTNVSCNGGSNADATAAGNGGTGTYTFSWNTTPVQNTAVVSGLTAGSYTVTITDQNACISTATATITEPAPLNVTITAQTDVACSGGTNGSATAAGNGGAPGYSYSWNTVPVQNTATASNLGAGTYTVTVTDLNSCSSSTTATILEAGGLSFTLDSQLNPSCNGLSDGSIYTNTSGGTAPYSYAWTPAVSTVDSALNLAAGSYDITLTDANGCTQVLNVTLADPALLTAGVSATSTSFCLGGSSTLSTAIAGGTGAYSYSWSNGSALASQLVQPIVSTNYILTVTDANSCTAVDSVFITVFQPGVIDLGNDTAICQGDVLTLNAGPGFTSYLWQNGTSAQTLNAAFADQYFVTGTDANGCTVSDTILLNINPLPVIGLADTVKICPGIPATLNANPGYSSYSWSNGANTASISVSAAGNNVVTVQDANGCINMDSTMVRIHPVPVLVFSISPLTGCAPVLVVTDNNSLLNGSTVTWNWQIGGESSNEYEPTALLTTAGLYDISLQATTSNGCIVDTLLSNYVEVYPVPEALAVPGAQEYELHDDNISIQNLSTGATGFTWSLFGNYLTNDTDLLYPVTDTGSFTFQLLAVNQYGCMDSTEVTVIVNPSFAIYFPNAFSPNVNGINDLYSPKGYGIREYDLMIFDRWGELVFRTNSLNIGWDGTYKGGAPFKDVYVYKCRIRDSKGDPHYYMGHITLVD